jgi:hypothetical protein
MVKSREASVILSDVGYRSAPQRGERRRANRRINANTYPWQLRERIAHEKDVHLTPQVGDDDSLIWDDDPGDPGGLYRSMGGRRNAQAVHEGHHATMRRQPQEGDDKDWGQRTGPGDA